MGGGMWVGLVANRLILGKWILDVCVGLMWVMVGWVVRGGGCGERVVCGKWVLTGWF